MVHRYIISFEYLYISRLSSVRILINSKHYVETHCARDTVYMIHRMVLTPYQTLLEIRRSDAFKSWNSPMLKYGDPRHPSKSCTCVAALKILSKGVKIKFHQRMWSPSNKFWTESNFARFGNFDVLHTIFICRSNRVFCKFYRRFENV